MSSATGNASAHTPTAGDCFIFRGGDTWHFTTGTPGTGGAITISQNGTSGNPIYWGFDLAWFSGGSFARPIFSMDNALSTSFVASCSAADDNSSVFFTLSGNHVWVDGFEFTGACWNGNPSGSIFNVTGTNDVVSRVYFHGWTAGNSASDDTWRFVSGSGGLTNEYLYDVIDGSDSTAGAVCTTSSCVASVWNGAGTPSPIPATLWAFDDCGTMAYTVIKHTSQGCQAGNIGTIHDNLFQWIFEPGYTRHGNVIETLANSTTTFIAYNNRTSDINEGENWNPAAPTMYIFNNEFQNDQHFPPDPNCLLLEPFGNNAAGVITVNFANNTEDGTCKMSAHSSTWNAGSAVNCENNHLVGFATPCSNFIALNSQSATITDHGGEVFMTTGTAASQGYTLTNFFSPTVNTNSTVGAGNNMTSQCSTYSSDSALCSGMGGVTEVSGWGGQIVQYPAVTINGRPAASAWDAGAYEFLPQAANPSCSPGTGTYSSTQSVTCTDSSAGAIMCYSTNGSTPATNGSTGCNSGTLYSGAISISSDLTLKVIAGGTGYSDSSVVSYTYTFTAANAPTFSPGTGTYTTTQSVTLSTTSPGAVICWNNGGSSPATNGASGCSVGNLYTAPISVFSTQTIFAVAGGTDYSDSTVASASYIIASNGSIVIQGGLKISGGIAFFTPSGAPSLPDPALLNWNTTVASRTATNTVVCIGTPSNAAALPGGGCAFSYSGDQTGIQNAYNAVACGDIINLQNISYNVTTGINLPNKPCSPTAWIRTTHDLSDATFPAEGTRIDPCYEGITQNTMPYLPYPLADATPNTCPNRHVPQILCNVVSGNPCLGMQPAASTQAMTYYSFEGIDFARGQNMDAELALFDLTYQPSTDCAVTEPDGKVDNNSLPINAKACYADQPTNIIFDRDIWDGDTQRQTVIGLKLGGARWVAVLDNYAYGIKTSYGGGEGDGHFYGGGTGHALTGGGDYKFANNFTSSSTEGSVFCGAFTEPVSVGANGTGLDGIPHDVHWTQEEFYKNPLWDTQMGQTANAAVTIEGKSYGPVPDQEFDVAPATFQIAQGNSLQLQTLVLFDSSGGINRFNDRCGATCSQGAVTVDGVVGTALNGPYGNSTTGFLVKVGESNVGSGAWLSANQVTYSYVACSGSGTPISACTGATTLGSHAIVMSYNVNDDRLATIGNVRTLCANSTSGTPCPTSVTVTVTNSPASQIYLSPASANIEIQPSYSDSNSNKLQYCYTVYADANYANGALTFSVDSIAGGNSSVGTITTPSGVASGEAVYCSPSTAGSHNISVTDGTATSNTVAINVTASSPIWAYDLKPFTSKNVWEMKCGTKWELDHSLGILAWGSNGNGGGQPGWAFLDQTINQASQTLDGAGVSVGYGPEHSDNGTINYFHTIDTGTGEAVASLNSSLGIHKLAFNNILHEAMNPNMFGHGWQKQNDVVQFSGTASTNVIGWTNALNPLSDNISWNHVTAVSAGGITAAFSIANNKAQFQLGPWSFTNSLIAAPGSHPFFDANGESNDCNQSSIVTSSNESLTFQGTGLTPNDPCFSSYNLHNDAFLDSSVVATAFCANSSCGTVNVQTPSTNIWGPASTASDLFPYYNSSTGLFSTNATVCTGNGTPVAGCTAGTYAAGGSRQASDGLATGVDGVGMATSDLAVRTGTRTP